MYLVLNSVCEEQARVKQEEEADTRIIVKEW